MLTVLGIVAVLLGVLVSPVVAAPGGNADNAAKCANGGYLTYTDANGTPFKNAGECTRYGAQVGELTPVPTAVLTFFAISPPSPTFPGHCNARLTVTGYAAGTYTVQFNGDSGYPLVVGADGTGVATSEPNAGAFGTVFPPGWDVTAAIDWVPVATETAAC